MHQQRPYKHNEILASNKAIYVSIRFGNPTSGDCRNFGICKMEVFDGTITQFQKKTGYALARLTIVNDKKQIIFEKSSMTKVTQELYFGNGVFLMEVEVPLGDVLSRRLGIKNTFLKVGRHPFLETLTNYTIEI